MNEFLLGFAISLIGLFFLFFNSISSLIIRKKVKLMTFNFFSTYLLIMAIIELFCHVLGVLKPGSNIFISHFYFNFQFLIISIFFLQLFKKNTRVKNWILRIMILVFLIVAFSFALNKELFWKFNLVEIGATTLALVGFIAYYFYDTMEHDVEDFHNFFGGLIVYLLSSSLIFLTGNEELVIIKDPYYIDIWVFNSLFYITFQFFVFREIQYFRKNIR